MSPKGCMTCGTDCDPIMASGAAFFKPLHAFSTTAVAKDFTKKGGATHAQLSPQTKTNHSRALNTKPREATWCVYFPFHNVAYHLSMESLDLALGRAAAVFGRSGYLGGRRRPPLFLFSPCDNQPDLQRVGQDPQRQREVYSAIQKGDNESQTAGFVVSSHHHHPEWTARRLTRITISRLIMTRGHRNRSSCGKTLGSTLWIWNIPLRFSKTTLYSNLTSFPFAKNE